MKKNELIQALSSIGNDDTKQIDIQEDVYIKDIDDEHNSKEKK